jgi:hypothetical protein
MNTSLLHTRAHEIGVDVVNNVRLMVRSGLPIVSL